MTVVSEPIIEGCRAWVGDNRCPNRAVVLVWGKMHEPDELGPRCEDHIPATVRRYWPHLIDQYAALDLRGLVRSSGSSPA